ncbi:MAG: response regulator [Myxococcales bacterium]|nr:response regulator [Myxococcales bacterium]MCB9548436.1 response regulator [Myxococcales bacterium]
MAVLKVPTAPVVLVAEDDVGVRAAVSDLLGFLGCEVLEAATGEEAVELARVHGDRLAAALVDVRMPGMGGPTACQHILAGLPDLPLAVTTGYGDFDGAARAGAWFALPKPFGLDTLMEVMGRLGVAVSWPAVTAAG